MTQKFFGTTNFLVKQIFCVKKVKIFSKKLFGLKKLGQRKFFQNKGWSTKFKNPKKLDPKIFVKIGSETAEIMVTWTNVAGTYIS